MYKAYAELRTEIARSYMGLLWWIIEPMLFMAGFYVVFAYGFRSGKEGFATFLLIGLVPWKWFSSTISTGSNAIMANMGVIRQIALPKYVLPLSVMMANTVKFGIILLLLVLYLAANGIYPGMMWLALPLIIIVQFMFMAALTCILAAVVPLVPDLKLLVSNGLTVGMLISGIFFDIKEFPPDVAFYLRLNPMATILESYRLVFLNGAWPDWQALTITAIICIPVIFLGLLLMARLDRLYPKIAT